MTTNDCMLFKVIFEAVRGSDFRSDIALDDVKFEDGPCGKNSVHLSSLVITLLKLILCECL